MAGLPPRDDAAEDAFVDRWRSADDDAALVDVLRAAVAARRVRLAGRLAQLLPDDVDDPAVGRARRAAALVLHDRLDPADVSWSALEEALAELHRERIDRAKLRQRRRAAGDDRRIGRLDGRRRR